jgi:hypothetical protein
MLPKGLGDDPVCWHGFDMSAVEVIREIQSLPEEELQQVLSFVIKALRPAWATPKPPGSFADCYTPEEIEVTNWLADQGPKTVVP